MEYRFLNEFDRRMLDGFDRHQDVRRCWRKANGEWVLRDIAFVEEWDERKLDEVADDFRRTLARGGAVIAALDGARYVGFATVEAELFGSRGQYAELASLHVTYPMRGRGAGRALFGQVCAAARAFGAARLYISAHSSEESQAFYRTMGCVEATEYSAPHVEREPCDVQMEYVL